MTAWPAEMRIARLGLDILSDVVLTIFPSKLIELS